MPTRSKKRFIVSRVKHAPKNSLLDKLVDDPKNGFRVGWKINPHMQVGASDLNLAEREHDNFIAALEDCGAEILQVPFIPGAYDSVFMKDDAFMIETEMGSLALLAKPFTAERSQEPKLRAAELEAHGIEIAGECEVHLEGGDIVFSPEKRFAFMGYGFRTDRHAAHHLANFLECEVQPLELNDPYFYHLDTALNITCVNGRCIAFAYPGAFTNESWLALNRKIEIDDVIAVSREEALQFALNWVEVDNSIILGSHVPETRKHLERIGKRVLVRPLSQFQLAGGSAACLVAAVHAMN